MISLQTLLTLYDLGAIDATHIPISQPRMNSMAYTTNKEFTAVSLQAVCINNLKFIDVSAGWAGSIHNARIFRLSTLSSVLATELKNTDYFLIGDRAYPLQKHLMKPFRNNDNLSEAQMQFNNDLCSSRSCIEYAFGLLKGKWRKLQYIEIINLSCLSDIIISACVLHNYLIDWANKDGNEDHYEDDDENIYEDGDEDEDEVDEDEDVGDEDDEDDELNEEDKDEDEDEMDEDKVEDGRGRRQRILRNYE